MNHAVKEKMPSSIVDAQLQRLLQIVHDYQKKQCEELIAQAHEQARQVVRHTYRNARNRLRTYIQEDRQQLEQSLASVRAKRHTFIMQQKHQASRLFLDDSWNLLAAKLVQRWGDADHRKLWVRSIFDVALASLPAANWTVEYNEQWSKSEQKQLLDNLEQKNDRKIELQALKEIEAGIRISGGGAIVDGTLEGLLNDRIRIESEILAQCSHCVVRSAAGDSQ